MKKYTIGFDFDTESTRVVSVDVVTGDNVTSPVFQYADVVIDEALPGSDHTLLKAIINSIGNARENSIVISKNTRGARSFNITKLVNVTISNKNRNREGMPAQQFVNFSRKPIVS